MFYIMMKFIYSISDVFILFQIYSELFSDMTYQIFLLAKNANFKILVIIIFCSVPNSVSY